MNLAFAVEVATKCRPWGWAGCLWFFCCGQKTGQVESSQARVRESYCHINDSGPTQPCVSQSSALEWSSWSQSSKDRVITGSFTVYRASKRSQISFKGDQPEESRTENCCDLIPATLPLVGKLAAASCSQCRLVKAPTRFACEGKANPEAGQSLCPFAKSYCRPRTAWSPCTTGKQPFEPA